MVSKTNNRNVVVVQLSGGNDTLNTVIPYNNEIYYDLRPQVHIPQEKVLKITEDLGFNPSMAPMKRLWDEDWECAHFDSLLSALLNYHTLNARQFHLQE